MTSSPQPLAGRRVLLPRRLDPRLRASLEAAGAEVDEVALLDRRPVSSAGLDALPGRIGAGEVDWLVIASAYTVTALELLGHPLAGIVTSGVGLAAVGPASAAAVKGAAGRVDLVPSTGTGGAALAEVFPSGPGRVVIPGAAAPSPGLPERLRARGWEVAALAVYETLPAASVPAAIGDRWRTGGYDALVVTSASVADAAAVLLGTPGRVVAVGGSSAEAANRAGFGEVTVARSATAADIVRALVG